MAAKAKATKPARNTKLTVEDKTYVLELKSGGLRRITVPATWKVTFGPLIPGERHGSGTLALRFYEGKDMQRAIFTDVKSFRDESIPVEERVTRTKQQRMRKATPEGERDVVVEAKIHEWRNPDEPHEPDDDFLALPVADDE